MNFILSFTCGTIFFVILLLISNHRTKKLLNQNNTSNDREYDANDTPEELPNTEITVEDELHEITREYIKRQEARIEYIQESNAEQERILKEALKHIQQNPILKPAIFLFPILFAVAAAVGNWHSWFYTIFKAFVLLEAVVLIGLRLGNEKYKSEKILIATVYMSVMAIIGLCSFSKGGFDKSFWVILDIAYCIMHCILYLGLVDIDKKQKEYDKQQSMQEARLLKHGLDSLTVRKLKAVEELKKIQGPKYTCRSLSIIICSFVLFVPSIIDKDYTLIGIVSSVLLFVVIWDGTNIWYDISAGKILDKYNLRYYKKAEDL